jgi:hypothetical protein
MHPMNHSISPPFERNSSRVNFPDFSAAFEAEVNTGLDSPEDVKKQHIDLVANLCPVQFNEIGPELHAQATGLENACKKPSEQGKCEVGFLELFIISYQDFRHFLNVEHMH